MKIINQKQKRNKEISCNRKWMIRAVLLLLLIVSLHFYKDSLQSIFAGIRQVTWMELCISILFSLSAYLLEGVTIFCMMSMVIPCAKAGNGVFIAFVCEFYRLTTLGSGSGIAEIHYLTEKKIEAGKAATLTMIQYVIKRIAIMLFGVIGFLFLYHNKRTQLLCRKYMIFMGAGCLVTMAVIVLFLCVALSSRLTIAVLRLLDRISLKFPSKAEVFQKWKEQITLLNQSGRNILGQKRKIICALLVQIGKLALFYSIPAYFFYGKTNLMVSECIWLMAVAFMLAGVIPTPSGAVSLEFVFLLFFTEFVDYNVAVPAILIFRFATWICPALIGGVLLLVRKLRRKEGLY